MPGCIQPHGILIVRDAVTLMISHVSANVETLLGIAPAAFGSGPYLRSASLSARSEISALNVALIFSGFLSIDAMLCIVARMAIS